MNEPQGVTIDVQGFLDDNKEFILKEIAAVFENGENVHLLIRSPYDFLKLSSKSRQTATWLTKNHHNLFWNDGTISYSSVRKFLKTNLKDVIVFTKGVDKKRFLEKLLSRPVEDVEDFVCPRLNTKPNVYYNQCGYHHNNGNCALKNAFVLMNFYKNNINK